MALQATVTQGGPEKKKKSLYLSFPGLSKDLPYLNHFHLRNSSWICFMIIVLNRMFRSENNAMFILPAEFT